MSETQPTDGQIEPNLPVARFKRPRNALGRWMPRTETLILLIGFGCTVSGKLTILQRQKPPNVFTELGRVIFPDVTFFAGIALLIGCLYVLKPSTLVARCALVIAALVSVWSVLDLAWLTKCGFQMQPGILTVLIRDFVPLLPLVLANLAANLRVAIPLGVVICGISGVFFWRFYRPNKVVAARIHYARRSMWMAAATILLLLVRPVFPSDTGLSFRSKLLGFSSHWYALVSTVNSSYNHHQSQTWTRNILQVGQRNVVPPKSPANQLPNVVLVLLESISYSVSLADPAQGPMPNLARLARDGVEFRSTRVPVPWTTKAFWATLTSTTPIVQASYVEAIPAHQPYEGLPSLLARAGYRSAFFEMSNGACECAPGLFSNLAFDWAWFRENLEDRSTHLSKWSGDDLKVIKPAFEWVSAGAKPFFLMMITSVAHEPFTLPAGIGRPREKPYDKYVEAVRYTDYVLGQICRTLEARGLAENTILCVLGDHGTSFRADGGRVRWVPYEEVIRVPWIIRWPGHIKPGQIIDWPSSQLDVTPTILKLIGFDITDAGFEGKDAFTPSPPDRKLFFSSWYSNSPRGFVQGHRKIVYWPYQDKVFEYDLAADPKEETPRAISSIAAEQIKRDILDWQDKSRIVVENRKYADRFLFSHWRTFTVGQTARTYYVP